ncbi:hypothetical protein BAMTA208_07780 [Bacillus amyloliquefaciens TA208]|nr:hypothetical protein BAMTA208_07780 [Bacillus amyloliquefaciens TA208]
MSAKQKNPCVTRVFVVFVLIYPEKYQKSPL